MKLHHRVSIVQRAGLELSEFAAKLRSERELTEVEYLGILNEEVARVLKYALRAERHPDDPEKRAGEE